MDQPNKYIVENLKDNTRKMAGMNIRGNDENVLSADVISSKLSCLHCPFTWKPFNDANSRDTVNATEEKLLNVEDEGEEFSAWTTFVLSLILCYEYAKKDALDYAFEKQEECAKIVERAIDSGFSIPVMGVGLKHVSDACKIFLLMKSEQLEKATNALQHIADYDEMEKRDQASIWSVRGALLLEYGLKGMKESVPCLEQALLLDTECPEWHFLLGKALARVRRIEDRNKIPDKKELKALEYAVTVSENTFYMVLLAQSYTDAARVVTLQKRGSSDFRSLCEDMNEKAVNMYRKAYENSKDNPYVLGRCAYGFMRLPKPWKDMEVARICVEKGLAKNSSSSFLNYAAAELYNKQNDSDKAKYYFARAAENGCYGACLNLLTLKEKENKLYDAIPDLERYIELFKEKPRQEHLLALLGAYHYFVKSDFNMALKYWSKVIDSDIHSIELKALDNTWPKTPHPCNVSKTIVNEIVQRLDKGCNEEERAMYTNILQKYKKHHRPLVLSIQGIYSERSEYRRYCESENKPLPSTSKVWHNMNRNAVGNYWKVRPNTHSIMTNDWRQKSSRFTQK
ncbi:Uncharacterized protein GBIM_04873 [Gryllus bimaculatus]|nr:Uncharacterized protein GBIM_04873 [Gryllus bimaculatus]